MDIYVLNLDRSRARMLAFETLNGHLNVNFVRYSAVEGKDVARGPLVDSGVMTADLDYSDGALGCALSHLSLWDLAIERNQPLTVCEDDAIFNSGFETAAESQLESLPPDWHLILWGWNFDSILLFDMIPGVSPCFGVFDQNGLRKGIEAFRSASLTPRAYKVFRAFGTVGYSVSPAGARAMKQRCLPLRKMDVFVPGFERTLPNSGIDTMLNQAYPALNAYVSIPPVIVTMNLHGDSTVQNAP